MIPRVARGSTSFGEARNYYLHDKDGDVLDLDEPASPMEQAGDYALKDKGGARTSHRVGFTETLNLNATGPADAIQEMQERYDSFRAQEHHKRGRKLQKPVYTYSLSWSPDEKPSRDDLMAAARSSLKAMRLEGLQTLVVQHLDEPQSHIHLIVHRIEPDGKRARNIPWDHLRFSRWAEAYEKEHGKVLCDQRARNNAARDKGVFVKDEVSLPRRAYEALHHSRPLAEIAMPRTGGAAAITGELFQRHVSEREQLAQACKLDVAAREHGAREALGKTWSAVYQRQEATMRELRVADRGGVLERAVFIYRHKPLLEQAGRLTPREITGLCLSGKKLVRAVQFAHREERGEMARFEQGCVAKAAEMALDDYRLKNRELVARQSAERDLLVARVTADLPSPALPPKPELPPSAIEEVRVPDLCPGELLTPDAVHKLVTDVQPLRETFAERAAPQMPPRANDDFDRDF